MKPVKVWMLLKGNTFVAYENNEPRVQAFSQAHVGHRAVERNALQHEDGRLFVLDVNCPVAGVVIQPPPEPASGWARERVEVKVTGSDRTRWQFTVPLWGRTFTLSGLCYYGFGSEDGVPPEGAVVEVFIDTRQLGGSAFEMKVTGVRRVSA